MTESVSLKLERTGLHTHSTYMCAQTQTKTRNSVVQRTLKGEWRQEERTKILGRKLLFCLPASLPASLRCCSMFSPPSLSHSHPRYVVHPPLTDFPPFPLATHYARGVLPNEFPSPVFSLVCMYVYLFHFLGYMDLLIYSVS